ncbi:hypothetical protein VTO73DRAFT_15599 [Trametes versicolor]
MFTARSLRELQASRRDILEVKHRKHSRRTPHQSGMLHSRAHGTSRRRGTAHPPIVAPTRTRRPDSTAPREDSNTASPPGDAQRAPQRPASAQPIYDATDAPRAPKTRHRAFAV